MKINLKERKVRRLERRLKLLTWHKKFAWLPTRVNKNEVHWLEFVQRSRGLLRDRFLPIDVNPDYQSGFNSEYFDLIRELEKLKNETTV